MDTFPQTPTGQVNRSALPAPGATTRAATAYVAPRTELERALAGVWADVLGVDRAGLRDDFFALGGHSLLAAMLVSRLRSVLGVELPIASVFAHPVLAEQAAVVAELHSSRASAPIQPLDRRPQRLAGIEGDVLVLPASHTEQRLWFLEEIGAAAAYDLVAAVRLQGPLDPGALNAALTGLVARHEVLRTTFAAVDGVVHQVVHPPQPVSAELVDVSVRPHREAEARAVLEEQARQRFDLRTGPLMRVTLVRLAPEEHILVVALHHIVSDVWSLDVITAELGELYSAARDKRAPALAELAIQYADYAGWQLELWRSGALEPQLTYWRERLAGAPALLELPADFPRPERQSFRGGARTRTLSAELTDRLRALGRSEGATPFMALLAAFATFLNRLSGQDDLVIATPVASRSRVELEPLVGSFLNTLALRHDLSEDPTFRQLIAQVRDTALRAFSHQELPFEQLVSALSPERHLSHAPIAQVMFNFLGAETTPLALPGFEAAPVAVPHTSAQFDLAMDVVEAGDGIRLTLEYASDLFTADTAERMLAAFATLVGHLTADPDRPVSTARLLDGDARRRLLDASGPGRTPYPAACLHELFTEAAAACLDRIAVQSGDETLTYAELDARSSQLAHHLRGLGVGPDILVGVCLNRGVDLLSALLGVLKAGGAYVPIDPTYPAARQAFMLHDADVPVVVTETGVTIPEGDYTSVRLDADWPAIAAHPKSTPPDTHSPDQLAYVIYTSGSTGTPKGVEITHRSLVNFLTTMARRPGLAKDDVLLAVTTLSFDIAGLELYLPLLTGARTVIARTDQTADPAALSELIRRYDVTILQATPTTWRLLLDHGWHPEHSFRALCGGEALPSPLAERLLAAGVELWNMYGPTETTIWSTCARVEPDAPLTIGRPIANTTTYVLDRHLEPQPPGVPGELWIGGDGLARGYRNRPELTAERFVPNPFVAGERMYRTGDLARVNRTGDIEFLGRADQQVKLRGFRIELGEIETALAGHPDVADAAVAAHDDELVAYVVPRGAEPSAAALRAHLRRTLPEYMVPAAYVALTAFPQTPNGKLDRTRLPAPDTASRATAEYVAPDTDLEHALGVLWSEILGVERIGRHDDFFALGGHSLLAMMLALRVRERFGAELPVTRVFAAPTLAEQAGVIAELKATPASRPIPRLPRETQTWGGEQVLVLPASSAEQRLWFLDQLDTRGGSYDILQAVRLQGPLDTGALQTALSELVARHETLRTTFALIDGALHQVVHPPAALPFPITDLSGRPDPEQSAETEISRALDERFDLGRGPLLRAELLRLAGRDHVLLLALHHIITDMWSLNVLARELAELYSAASEQRAPALPELAIQYGDYAAWQQDVLASGALEPQLEYWREQLEDAPALLELPTDVPRPDRQSFRGGTRTLTLDPGLSARVRALARGEGATTFMALLAAFATFLHRLSGQDDIVIATPVPGRDRVELEPLIGFFVNTLALHHDLCDDHSFRELLDQVRRRTVSALAHQDLPFEQLIADLAPERHLSHAPIAQVMFSFQSEEEGQLALPGLQSHLMPVAYDVAKFDLALTAIEAADGLQLHLEFASDLFTSETADRLLGQFSTLLESLTAEPDRPVSTAALLAPWERDAVLALAHGPEASAREACLHDLFAEVAAAHPDRIAVQSGGHTLTYAELDTRSSQLAHHLRAQGVAAQVIVGICLERSVDVPVAMLGVLKAGGAFLPIDPQCPVARKELMLADAQVGVLLTHATLVDRLPRGEYAMVRLDTDWPAIARHPASAPVERHSPDQLAYVIYTSGSTGVPKGVEIAHRGWVNLHTFLREDPGLTVEDVYVAVASISFDAACVDLFLPLLAGARLVVAPDAAAADPAVLAALLDRSGATYMMGTPSRWRLLLEVGWRGRAGFTAICGGEAVTPTLATRLLDLGCQVINHYGPTEATVNCTSIHLTERNAPVTLGRPIPGVDVYVLDRHLQPVPPGVAGELCIGGVGLARGYRNRPELTAERFVPNPFAAGQRLYRTGDEVRLRTDGTIEYLGRLDEQVKLRGYRIELGEIETALSGHPDVVDAVVTVYGRGTEAQLVAYLVARVEAPNVPGLAEYLRRTLPDYMVPSVFVPVTAFPHTRSGKLDRRALPAPTDGALADQELQPPRTPLERALAALFQRLLGVGTVGVDDDFFLLGGTSLLAVQLAQAIETELGETCTIAMVLRNKTIHRLAAELTAGGPLATQPVVLELAHGTGPALFCLVGVHIYQRLAERLAPEFSTYGIFLPVEQEMFSTRTRGMRLSMQALAEAYLDVIREHQPTGPYRLLGFCFGGVVAYEVARQLRERGEEVEVVVMIDSVSPALSDARARRAVQAVKLAIERLTDRLPRGWQERLRGAGWTAEERRLDRRRSRIYHAAGRRYQPSPYTGRTVLFLPDDASTRGPASGDHTWGWGEVAANLTVSRVGGAHTTWLEPPHVDAFAAALRGQLCESVDSPSSDAMVLPRAARTADLIPVGTA